MNLRPLENNVMQAENLKHVNVFSKMDVYVVISIVGDPSTKQKTPVAKNGGTNPRWNHSLKFTIDEAAAQQNRLTLLFLLRSERILGDKDITELPIPVKELLDVSGDGKKKRTVTCYVSSGEPQGKLRLSYTFGEKFTRPAGYPLRLPPPAAEEPRKKSKLGLGLGLGAGWAACDYEHGGSCDGDSDDCGE